MVSYWFFVRFPKKSLDFPWLPFFILQPIKPGFSSRNVHQLENPKTSCPGKPKTKMVHFPMFFLATWRILCLKTTLSPQIIDSLWDPPKPTMAQQKLPSPCWPTEGFRQTPSGPRMQSGQVKVKVEIVPGPKWWRSRDQNFQVRTLPPHPRSFWPLKVVYFSVPHRIYVWYIYLHEWLILMEYVQVNTPIPWIL